MNKSRFQILLEDTFESLLSVVKMCVLSTFRVRLPARVHDECVILGNGPSLTASIQDHKDFIRDKELVCVNYFAQTDLYTELKPKNYIVNAPELWRDDVDHHYLEKGEKLFETILARTVWETNLFIPISAKKFGRWKKKIKQNSLINIVYFNTTPIAGFSKFVFFMMKRNMGLPRPHNVLIPGIAVACNMGFQKIYLFGVDHSWLENIWVNDQNEVLLTQKHFYDKETATGKPMNNMGKGKRRLHEVLQKFAYTFRGYFVLQEYSQSLGIEIINMTPDSYIDAFPRCKSD